MKTSRYIAISLLFLFAVPALCGCNFSGASMTSSPTPLNKETAAAETTLLLHAQIDPVMYPDLEKLLAVTDIVIIGTVKETLPAVRLTQSDNDLWKSAVWEEFNVTPSLIQVDEVLKSDAGDVTTGETIRIDQMGGFADNINETISYIKYPEVGSSYVMFITFHDSAEQTSI